MRVKVICFAIVVVLVISFCGAVKYYGEDIKIQGNNAPLTEEKQVYAANVPVKIDGIQVESLRIDGDIVIALEDLNRCDFREHYHFDGETFDMVAGRGVKYEYKKIMPREDGALLGSTTPTADIVRVNGVKIYSDLFDGKHYVSVKTLGDTDDPYNREWGYSDYNMKLADEGDGIRLDCFRFPPLNYGERLAEAEKTVDVTEADIYTETDISEVKHYGGIAEPPTGVYAGIVGDGNGGANEKDKPTFNHSFAVYSSYIEFDQKQDELHYPNKRIVQDNDCVMLVPWNVEDITLVFDEDYQDYIHKTLNMLQTYQKPVIVRFGAEMNIGYLGNSPSAYIKAFRYMADIIHDYGFAVMWAPNDMCELGKDFSFYYPGDEYVDWIGVSCFMRMDYLTKTPTKHSDAMLFNFGDYAYHTNSLKYITAFMERNNIQKPLAVSEGGVISLADYEGAPKSYTVWAHERLGNMYWYLPMRYPQIKMITYFNHTSKGAKIGYWLKDKPDYITIIEDALQNGPYLLNGSDETEFTFVKADNREYTKSEIPIYTYLYKPGRGGHKIEYSFDGELIDTKTKIPYKTILHESDIGDGRHKLSIIADGEKVREYNITKKNHVLKID